MYWTHGRAAATLRNRCNAIPPPPARPRRRPEDRPRRLRGDRPARAPGPHPQPRRFRGGGAPPPARPDLRLRLRRGGAQRLAARQPRAFEQYEFVHARADRHLQAHAPRRRCSASATRRPSASRRWASARCPPTAATWCWRRRAARENVPMIMSGSSLIRLEEIVQANPDAWFQAYLPGDGARDRGAGRAREGGGLPHAGGHGRRLGRLQPREQHPRRLLHAAAPQPAPRLGRPHASALAVRHLPADARCATACRTSRTTTPRRGAPILSLERAARLLRPRPPELGALAHDPRGCGRAQLVVKGILDVRDARLARGRTAPTASSSPTTAAASSTARWRRCACCPASSRPAPRCRS